MVQQSGAGQPYDGTASVWGRPSPIYVGNERSCKITGLDLSAGAIYYVSLKSMDVAGATSEFALEKSWQATACGDVDASGSVNVADAVYLICCMFQPAQCQLPPAEVGDVNCSGAINMADIVYIITYIFGEGLAPCAECP